MGIPEYLIDRLTSYASRTRPTVTYESSGKRFVSGSVVSSYAGECAAGYGEEKTSLNHPEWHYRKGRARDIGGPFFHRKVSVGTNFPATLELSQGNTSFGYVHSGFLAPIAVQRLMRSIQDRTMFSGDIWTSDHALPRGELRALGLEMMLSASPTTPAFQAANALGELISEKKFFSIPGRDLSSQKGLAGEYLNLQFGILPVISDVKDLIDVHERSEAIMQQYLRDSGKPVSRRREKPTEVTTSTTTYTTGGPIQLLAANGTVLATALGQPTKLTITQKMTRDVWFSGLWRYYVPVSTGSWIDSVVDRNRVYGFVPTPSTAWELTPFSWLVDWFLNVDDFIRQAFIAGTDGSVPVRSYVMCKTTQRTEYTWTGNLRVAGSWKPHTFSWWTDETIHQREKARAYGLDWKSDGLTAKQLSILTALGIVLGRS